MATVPGLWILEVNEGRGRLLRGGPVPNRHYHFDVCAELEGTPDEHQHGRPSPRTGKDGHSYASWKHHREEHLRRFAKRVASWTEEQLASKNIEHLFVFASDRMLGALRQEFPEGLKSHIEERRADLGHVEPGNFPGHPAILELIERTRAQED